MLPSPSNYFLPHFPRLSHAHTNKIKKLMMHLLALLWAPHSLPFLTHILIYAHTQAHQKSILSLLPLTTTSFPWLLPPSFSLNFYKFLYRTPIILFHTLTNFNARIMLVGRLLANERRICMKEDQWRCNFKDPPSNWVEPRLNWPKQELVYLTPPLCNLCSSKG